MPPSGGFPHETQAAEGGGVVVFSGNNGAFYSVDGGRSFGALSQTTVFGNVGGGYCCDTLVRYAPSIDRFLWLMQGRCTAGCGSAGRANNSQYVLAVASPRQIRDAARNRQPVERVWLIYDIDHSLFPGVRGWFDFPDMAVGRSNLYLTWNRLNGGNLGTVNTRIPLWQLPRGQIRFDFFTEVPHGDNAFLRTAQVPGARGIWVSNYDGRDDMSIAYILEDGSRTIVNTRLPHLRLPLRDYGSQNPFGEDWAQRTNTQSGSVRAATVRANELWLGWAIGRGYADQSGNLFPQPGVQYAAFRLPPAGAALPDRLPTVRENYVVNPSVGITYPYFNTTSDGEVVMAASFGGPRNPSGALVGFLTGRDRTLNVYAEGDNTNTGGDRQQGDYSSVQPSYPNAREMVAAGYDLSVDPVGSRNHYWFFRFRRGIARVQQTTRLSLGCPGALRPGTNAAVTGSLTPSLAGAQVSIEYQRQGSVDRITRSTTTDGQGRFSDSFPFGSAGTWTVRVGYGGNATFLPASATCTVNATVLAPPSSLTLACPPRGEFVGGTIAVSGALNPVLAGAVIEVRYQPPGLPEILHTVQTDAQGVYSDTYTTTRSGDLTIRARFPGTAQRAAASAPPCTVSILPVPG